MYPGVTFNKNSMFSELTVAQEKERRKTLGSSSNGEIPLFL
jgi:hypothetical protein